MQQGVDTAVVRQVIISVEGRFKEALNEKMA